MVLDPATRRQILRFTVSGVMAVAVDYLTYLGLCLYLNPDLSKGISFICGTVIAYVLNKFWTFENKKFSGLQLFKFFALYGVTLGFNIGTNHLALLVYYNLTLAFLCATGVSTVLNFLGQKFWVFAK